MSMKPSVRGLELVGLAFAVCLIVVLSFQNDTLREEIARIRAVALSAYPGMYVPALSVLTTDGRSVQIGAPPPGRRQILFFLRTDCQFSRASLAEWEQVRGRAAALGFETFGIAFDSLSSSIPFVQDHDLEFPLVPLPDERIAGVFRVSGVPMTMVIDDRGRVTYSRRGVFTGVDSDSLVAFLSSTTEGFPTP